MSHFTVAVFSKGPGQYEELLAPYDEGLSVEPYIDYTREEAIEYVRNTFDGYADKSDDECYKFLADDYEHIDEHGNLLTTYNPKSKWDWYDVGGRWQGLLKLKSGESCNEAYIRDCVFQQDVAKYQNAARFWEAYVERGDGIKIEDDFRAFYNPQYYIDKFGTKDAFAEYRSTFNIYAYVSEDGEWHDAGKMGFWGFNSVTAESRREYNKAFSEYIDYARREGLYITIVDCHI